MMMSTNSRTLAQYMFISITIGYILIFSTFLPQITIPTLTLSTSCRFNRLISKLASTLGLLRKALAGEIGMDAVLDNVAYSLFNGQLPAAWRGLAPDTRKGLGGWIDHFMARTKQYTDWVRCRFSYYKIRLQLRLTNDYCFTPRISLS